MDIKKRKIADIPWVYAVATVELNNKTFFMAASELEGEGSKCILFDMENDKSYDVWNSPGGVMTIIPIPGHDGEILIIEKFYPVFKSKEATISKVVLELKDEQLSVEKKEICFVPYAHRITLLEEQDGLYLAVASLCKDKDFIEDWSKPGSVYIGKYGDNIELEECASGLTKNHGMFTEHTSQGDVLWIGSNQGTMRFWKDGSKWLNEVVIEVPTSDIWIDDIDGDGEKEIAIIEEFHGNSAQIYKKDGQSYKKVIDVPISFGHVIWMGKINSDNYMITASRADQMDIQLHRIDYSDEKKISLKTEVIDTGVGCTQIALYDESICAANHETGTVDVYTF